MIWKIIGIVALVWIALAVIGALLKGLFWVLVIGALVAGGYLLFKAMSSSEHRDLTRVR